MAFCYIWASALSAHSTRRLHMIPRHVGLDDRPRVALQLAKQIQPLNSHRLAGMMWSNAQLKWTITQVLPKVKVDKTDTICELSQRQCATNLPSQVAISCTSRCNMESAVLSPCMMWRQSPWAAESGQYQLPISWTKHHGTTRKGKHAPASPSYRDCCWLAGGCFNESLYCSESLHCSLKMKVELTKRTNTLTRQQLFLNLISFYICIYTAKLPNSFLDRFMYATQT